MLLNKIENAPWYVKVFIGSWVSLYTSLFIWFVLTSWNPALYEGEPLKLQLIEIAFYLGFIWVGIVALFNICLKKTLFKKILTAVHFIILLFLIKPLIVLMLFMPLLLRTSTPPKYISFHPIVMGYELSSLRIPPISFREAYNKKDKEYSYHTKLYNNDQLYSSFRFIYHYNIFYYIGEDFFKMYSSYIHGGGGKIKNLHYLKTDKASDFTIRYNSEVWFNSDQNIYKTEYFDYLETTINRYKEKIKKYQNNAVDCKLKDNYSYFNMIDETENKMYCTRLFSFYVSMHYALIYYTDLLTGNYLINISLDELKLRNKFAIDTVDYLQKNMPKDLQKLTNLNKLKDIIKNR